MNPPAPAALSDTELLDPRGQALFIQNCANRLYEAANYICAYKAMARVAALCRQIPANKNPLVKSAGQFLGRENLAYFRPEPTPTPGPEGQPDPTADDLGRGELETKTPEERHAFFVAILEGMRARAAEARQDPVTVADLEGIILDLHGPEILASIRAVQARLNAEATAAQPDAPSG
jgi:hypothetical protein